MDLFYLFLVEQSNGANLPNVSSSNTANTGVNIIVALIATIVVTIAIIAAVVVRCRSICAKVRRRRSTSSNRSEAGENVETKSKSLDLKEEDNSDVVVAGGTREATESTRTKRAISRESLLSSNAGDTIKRSPSGQGGYIPIYHCDCVSFDFCFSFKKHHKSLLGISLR